VVVDPGSSISGEIVTIKFSGKAVKDPAKLAVLVKDINADILSVTQEEIKFLLPELGEGSATIQVTEDKNQIGNATITILPHPAVKLVFEASGDSVRILGKFPVNKIPDQSFLTDNANHLAFLLMNKDEVVTEGVVDDYSQAIEVFPHEDGRIARIDSLSGHFTIIVPAIDGQNEIRLFKPSGNIVPFIKIGDRQPWQVIRFQN
jgi:hypothetical protein